MTDTIVHWCGSFGGPLCEADSDEVTRIRDFCDRWAPNSVDKYVFCKECAKLLDAEDKLDREESLVKDEKT
jgi:hypothetical protein